ncbi:MAG: hypothetical protein M1492_08670 [Gammaproteobacteria bacterium]|jgi:hypothetical protein|uniref:hypothetical protein n=1 Tax=Acidithiobacillus ferrooxidans TaxID=920 RepID=UPI002147A060|nr:hypothetical protein [Acidithiobacillus ferrooxidans]MCL4526524.1 hypothetical protein [Gammaproteobacteria bacterium]MCR1347066.1 hypothetical protein [Acidithiobacillus ferrooxidans]MCR1355870.1 hypothetical protein [Acidithiobacillus ferrooxidans]MDA8376735.1 hypothetical protein [Planctomycetia bacterium]
MMDMVDKTATSEAGTACAAGRFSTVHREESESIRLGDWFVCPMEKSGRILACVTEIGSNYVGLEGLSLDVEGHGGRYSWRQHRNDLHKLVPAQNWQELVTDRVALYQSESDQIMHQVQDITRRLGVRPQNTMIGEAEAADASGTALAVLSAEDDILKYALDLKSAQEDNLPALFKRMKTVQERMADWMQMPMIPLRTQMTNLESVMEPLKERVFQVGLYAGLTEQAVQIAEGQPAAYHDKLHIFQLRRYMDEECLLDYNAGGIDIKGIEAFDDWLAKPENRDRILPLPRCMVAMRVRRLVKERDWEGSLRQLGINIELERSDKLTFLFVRNGENLYRINTEVDFPEHIFPESGDFMGGEPLMFRCSYSDRVENFITVRAYESMVAENAEIAAKKKAWETENPIEKWAAANLEKTQGESQKRVEWLWVDANPYGDWKSRRHSDLGRYEPLTPESIHYDDAMRKIDAQQKEFNRIALIIQGLLDRSTALHPHPIVNLATQEGFQQMIVLVRDGSGVLTHGEKPDFEAYRHKLNALITTDSFFVGQDTAWALAEGEKETRRMDADWRNKSEWRPKYHRPYGNPGPGVVSQAKQVTFKKGAATKATFVWNRQRAYNYYNDDRSLIPVKFTVPVDELLNVSAYRKGDYKIFFTDPRTRGEYLQWAPLLLEAEKWCQENGGA